MKFKPGDIITRVNREKGGSAAHLGELILIVIEPNDPAIGISDEYKPTGYWACMILKSPRSRKIGQILRFFAENLDTQYRRVDFGV